MSSVYQGVFRPLMLFEVPVYGPAGLSQLGGRLVSSRDLSDLGGQGRIAGSVKNLGTPDFPVWRRVRLFCRRDGRLVREVWSDSASGAYSFDYINPALRYTVIAYDHTGQYNAVISDDLTPEVMP